MNNVHQLELFYYVARHRGVCSAVRHMPYGIRQSSISTQILELEEDLGQMLYQRRPFRLTPAGEQLYDYVRPFFENLVSFTEKLRGTDHQVGLGAAPMVLRDYMPQILSRVRRRFPQLRFILKEGPQAQVEQWFDAQDIDLAVMEINANRPPACKVQSLLKLPIVLLVIEGSSIRSAEDLWKRDRLDENLIGPWPENFPGRGVGPGSAQEPIAWTTAIEVNSVELIEHYVRHGHGIGVSIAVPGKKLPPGLRALPLPGEPCVEVGALWRGKLHPAAEALLRELQKQAETLAA